jgi:DNA-directed RNA polymerase subunit F
MFAKRVRRIADVFWLLAIHPLVVNAQNCQWSSCTLKANPFAGCNSGYADSGETRDCGSKSFIGVYLNHQRMCCPSACKWYQVNCNWDSVQGYFPKASDSIKQKWNGLTEVVQDKLTTAEKFATLSAADLKNLDTELLAELKSVAGMTATQFDSIKDKVNSMSKEHLKDFVANLNADTLTKGLPAMASSSLTWSTEQMTVIKDRLTNAELWGPIGGWTSANLAALGRLISGIDAATLRSLANEALANAPNLLNLTSSQLGGLGQKLSGMGMAHLKKMLQSINASALAEGMLNLTGVDDAWAADKASAFIAKLSSTEAWGAVSQWTAANIGSIGAMMNSLNLTTIMQFTDKALAHAKSLSKLSPERITNLTDKIGGMATDNFEAMLGGLNGESIHAAMLSQCEIQCTHDEDLAFLKNPNEQSAKAALEAYAARVKEKSSAAALAYANGFCNGTAANYDSHARAAFADLQAAGLPCNGTVKKDNAIRKTFAKFSDSQASKLLARLTKGDALGSVSTWSDKQIASLCHQYGQLSPSNVAEMTAGNLITASAGAAKDAALISAFGPLAPVADYAIAQAAEKITPEKRASWAAKFKEGFGKIAGWGCAQVASMQTMVGGLSAADLPDIPIKALKGMKANAITAMSSQQIPGFTATQVTSLLRDVRERIHGDLVSQLSREKLVAAVCGKLNFTTSATCPLAAIDLSMAFPSATMPSKDALIQHFKDKLPNVVVRILMMANQSDLPTTTTSRRLAAESTQVAIRIGVQQPGDVNAITASSKAAATSLAGSSNGNVVQQPVGFNVDPSLPALYTGSTTGTTLIGNVAGAPGMCQLSRGILPLVAVVLAWMVMALQ